MFTFAIILAASITSTEIMEAKDEEGAIYFFTKTECPMKSVGDYKIASATPDGKVFIGCWKEVDNKIATFWVLDVHKNILQLEEHAKERFLFSCKSSPCALPYEGLSFRKE